MKKAKVILKTVNDVKEFVEIISRFDCDMDLISGRYAINAKSIMGIFSLDLSREIQIEIHSDDSADQVLKAIDKYIV